MTLHQPGEANGAAADSIAPIYVLSPMVDGIGGTILNYAILLAAIATIVMAMLELLKGLLGLRMRFHAWHLRRWVEAGGGKPAEDLRRDPPALEDLRKLCSVHGTDMVAILELPTDQMVGHLRSAAGVAIDFPTAFRDLNSFLKSLTPDMSAEWDKLSATMSPGEDAARSDNGEAAWEPDAIRARAKIDYFVTRRLDAFETHMEYWWARWNQGAAVCSGTLLIAVVLVLSGGAWSPGRVFQTGLLSVFGGMLAPFAKDVVSALMNLRARSA